MMKGKQSLLLPNVHFILVSDSLKASVSGEGVFFLLLIFFPLCISTYLH